MSNTMRGVSIAHWTKTASGYCAEISDFVHLTEHDRVTCPCGKVDYINIQWVKHRDNEGEATHWTSLLDCCGTLTLFND